VLENGRVTDKGTHFELIQRSDYYSELYHLQKLEEEQMHSMEEQGGEE
jgi:ABC-type multidrug transport system fused ATPase/permease subunit